MSENSTGVGSRGEKNRLKNRLRIRLRLNFDSMTYLNYIFLDFFQYRKSQADSQADSQAVFQAFFPPLDPTHDIWIRRHFCHSATVAQYLTTTVYILGVSESDFSSAGLSERPVKNLVGDKRMLMRETAHTFKDSLSFCRQSRRRRQSPEYPHARNE